MERTLYNSNSENDAQLLSDALIAEGSQDQAALLTGDIEKLTKSDIKGFINGEGREKLTDEVVNILAEITNIRMAKGQNIVPWRDIDDELAKMDVDPSNVNPNNMQGGVW